ncbi:MAG TPA: AEC family transporter [Abditibacteriaceae bacterium]
MIEWSNFWPAFWPALVGTLQVFAIGSAGFVLTRNGWLGANGLAALGQLVGLLTMPCLIIYRFATQFDPQTFPDWWKFALMGGAITGFGLILGKFVALRHGNNDEATLLVGFQNAGFFVLPMLQVMLPAADYPRASLMLFVFVIPFNASLWTFGTWLLLKKKGFNPRTILTPSFVATVGSLIVFGALHDWVHLANGSLIWQVLFGEGVPGTPGSKPGALQHLGDLTVPLATLTMGGSIAVNVRGSLAEIPFKRAALEVTFVKLVIYPLLGYFLVRQFLPADDHVVWTLLMLEFAAPPALALAVFSQQYGYTMKIIPAACLISYIFCLFTVPFFVALAP